MVDRTVRPLKAEAEDLRAAMWDVQMSIVAYHESTAGTHSGPLPFETQARATVAFIQKVNEVLGKQIGQQAKYRRIFERHLSESHRGAELIEGFRYARQVMAHQLFRTSPEPTRIVGGMSLGYQTSAVWGQIPRRVHNRLRPGTQKLRAHYDQRLCDKPVLDTFLDAAAYFAEVCPLSVHRDAVGEWSGFPLRSQPGLPDRIHPEEPPFGEAGSGTRSRHRRWLDGRRPGGDLRLVCGRYTTAGDDLLVGLTFQGRSSFTPFVESVDQVTQDLAMGYPYHLVSDATHHLEMRKTGPMRNGADLQYILSTGPLEEWVDNVVDDVASIEPFSSVLPADEWARQIDTHDWDPLVRRSQRLAAGYPPP